MTKWKWTPYAAAVSRYKGQTGLTRRVRQRREIMHVIADRSICMEVLDIAQSYYIRVAPASIDTF